MENDVELEVIESYSKNDSKLKKSCVIVKNGILKPNQCLVFEGVGVKVKNLLDYKGNVKDIAYPGDIIELEGIS